MEKVKKERKAGVRASRHASRQASRRTGRRAGKQESLVWSSCSLPRSALNAGAPVYRGLVPPPFPSPRWPPVGSSQVPLTEPGKSAESGEG